jgi:uncharacterized membrane protein YccC
MTGFLPSRSGRFRAQAAGEALDRHLQQSIADLSPAKESGPTMRGMKRLANLTANLIQQMDAEADAVANEIEQAHAEAQQAIGEFREHGKQIRGVAADIRAQLGQISNDPTQGSGA